MALPTEYTEDWGFNALGPELGIAVVEPYDGLLDEPVRLLALAPASGLFAAAGASAVVVGPLAELRAALRADRQPENVARIELDSPRLVAFSASEQQLFVCSADRRISAYRAPTWSRDFRSEPLDAPVLDMQPFARKQGLVLATAKGIVVVDEKGSVAAFAPDTVFALDAKDDIIVPSQPELDVAALDGAVGDILALHVPAEGRLLLVARSLEDSEEVVTYVRSAEAAEWVQVENDFIATNTDVPFMWHQGATPHWPTASTAFTAVAVSSQSTSLLLLGPNSVLKPMNESDNLPFTTTDEDVVAVGGALDVTDSTLVESLKGIEGKFAFPLWLVLTQEGRILGWHIASREASVGDGVKCEVASPAAVPELKQIAVGGSNKKDIADEELEEISESDTREHSRTDKAEDSPTNITASSDEGDREPNAEAGGSQSDRSAAGDSGSDEADDAEPNDAEANDTDAKEAKASNTEAINADVSGKKANDAKTNDAGANDAKDDGAEPKDSDPNDSTANDSLFNETSSSDQKDSQKAGASDEAGSDNGSHRTTSAESDESNSKKSPTAAIPKASFGSTWASKPGFSSWASSEGNSHQSPLSQFATSGTNATSGGIFGNGLKNTNAAVSSAFGSSSKSPNPAANSADSGLNFSKPSSSQPSLFGHTDPFAAYRNTESPFKSLSNSSSATSKIAPTSESGSGLFKQNVLATTGNKPSLGTEANSGRQQRAAEGTDELIPDKSGSGIEPSSEPAEVEVKAEIVGGARAENTEKADEQAKTDVKAENDRQARAVAEARADQEAQEAKATAEAKRRADDLATKIESTNWLDGVEPHLLTSSDILEGLPSDSLSEMDLIYAQTNALFQVLDHNISVLERADIYKPHSQPAEFTAFDKWRVADAPELRTRVEERLRNGAHETKEITEGALKNIVKVSNETIEAISTLTAVQAKVSDANDNSEGSAYVLRPLPARSAHYRSQLQTKLAKVSRLLNEAKETTLLKRTELGESIEFPNILAAADAIDGRLHALQAYLNGTSEIRKQDHEWRQRRGLGSGAAAHGTSMGRKITVDINCAVPESGNNNSYTIMSLNGSGACEILQEQICSTEALLQSLKARDAEACISSVNL